MKEDYLQYKLAEWLRKNDYLFFHIPNGELRDKRTAGKLKSMGVVAGVHDLIVIKKNEIFFIELKVGKNTLSKPQKIFHEKLAKMGFPSHLICRDDVDLAIDDLKEILDHQD